MLVTSLKFCAHASGGLDESAGNAIWTSCIDILNNVCCLVDFGALAVGRTFNVPGARCR